MIPHQTNLALLPPGVYCCLGTDAEQTDRAIEDWGHQHLLQTRRQIHWHWGFGNRLHWQHIEQLMGQMVQSGNIHILTTMNPLVVDRIPLTDEVDASNRLLFCRDNRLMRMSPTEACSFWQAFETRFQQTSEILRTKGLW